MVDYMTRLRVGRACSLLIESGQSIATIAADVGYTNLSLFNRQFARAKGATPSNFRKQHRIMLGTIADQPYSRRRRQPYAVTHTRRTK